MKTNIVTNRFTVPSNQNVKYLYNSLKDVVAENHIPATFKTDVVEITTNTQKQKETLLRQLIDLKAKFKMD